MVRTASNRGAVPVTAKVSEDTREILDAEADRLEINRAEMIRLILDDWMAVLAGNCRCPQCDRVIRFPETMQVADHAG